MTQSFLDTPVETFPLGVAKIQVQDGRWTFNNKLFNRCNYPIQRLVESYIKTNAFRMEANVTKRASVPSHSVIDTKETRMAHAHLKEHNYRFPDWVLESQENAKRVDRIAIDTIFPEFIPKTN